MVEEAANFFKVGRFEEAKACYEQVLAEEAYNPRALHGIGVIAFHVHDIETSLEYLQQALRVQPDYTTAYIRLGEIQKQLGRLLAAKISYQKALEIEPASCETLCALGAVCRDLNQNEMAAEYLHKALNIDATSSLAYYEFGCLHQKNKPG